MQTVGLVRRAEARDRERGRERKEGKEDKEVGTVGGGRR